MIITFGIWQVVDGVGIIGKEASSNEYIIDKSRLWEIYVWEEINLSDWAVHLSEKTWMTEPMQSDLFNALIFAQEYFSIEKKTDAKIISWAQTMFYAKEVLKLNKKFAELETGNVDITDVQDVFKYAEENNSLKPIIFPH